MAGITSSFDLQAASKRVCIVGTMDTKGLEFAFIKTQIEATGTSTYVMNTGILGEPGLTPDVSADEVAQAGGSSLQALRDEGDRGNSVAVMAQGAATLIAEKQAAGEIDGIISLGGSAGTTIGTTAMQAVPVGVPKIMVSTLASGRHESVCSIQRHNDDVLCCGHRRY